MFLIKKLKKKKGFQEKEKKRNTTQQKSIDVELFNLKSFLILSMFRHER